MSEVYVAGDEDAIEPIVEELIYDIEKHGEVHATFEDIDGEIEIRLGTATVWVDSNTIRINDGTTSHMFDLDNLVSWYKPYTLIHD